MAKVGQRMVCILVRAKAGPDLLHRLAGVVSSLELYHVWQRLIGPGGFIAILPEGRTVF